MVERKHQQLLNVTRSLLFQSRVPKKFWGDCLHTTCYLINRIPTAILKKETPYARLYHKQPTYDSLRVFGCLCYFSTLPSQRNKVTPRAKPAMFVGYPQGY